MTDLQEVAARYRDFDEVLLVDRDAEERKECLERGVKWETFVETYISSEVCGPWSSLTLSGA
jgi:hypothetical protein